MKFKMLQKPVEPKRQQYSCLVRDITFDGKVSISDLQDTFYKWQNGDVEDTCCSGVGRETIGEPYLKIISCEEYLNVSLYIECLENKENYRDRLNKYNKKLEKYNQWLKENKAQIEEQLRKKREEEERLRKEALARAQALELKEMEKIQRRYKHLAKKYKVNENLDTK